MSRIQLIPDHAYIAKRHPTEITNYQWADSTQDRPLPKLPDGLNVATSLERPESEAEWLLSSEQHIVEHVHTFNSTRTPDQQFALWKYQNHKNNTPVVLMVNIEAVSRYAHLSDFQRLVETCHERGVIAVDGWSDWLNPDGFRLLQRAGLRTAVCRVNFTCPQGSYHRDVMILEADASLRAQLEAEEMKKEAKRKRVAPPTDWRLDCLLAILMDISPPRYGLSPTSPDLSLVMVWKHKLNNLRGVEQRKSAIYQAMALYFVLGRTNPPNEKATDFITKLLAEHAGWFKLKPNVAFREALTNFLETIKP